MTAFIKASAVLVAAALLAPVAYASVHDQLFAGTFDIPADAPASTNDAARFLTQATFGPTQADINYLMAQGYSEWIDEQLAKPTTLSEPTVEAIVNARTAGAQNVSQTQRLNRWFWQATYAPDQLRQRMAFALSQIMVVSDQASTISQDVVPMAAYQDLLANDGFGSYRQLIGDVTYNPTMGKYLNAFRNVKGNCSGVSPNIVCTTLPDENYAREVMQLFSVGLVELDMQNNVVLSAGQPIPTYDQSVISSTAKVFTGFTYSDAPLGTGANYTGANFYGGGSTFATQYAPMVCWGTELFPYSNGNMRHDITGDDNSLGTPKTVLSWFVGGSLVSNTLPSSQTCGQDVGEELDIIAGHTNVAPFITRQLIQRFVTSNPSPTYIGDVTAVWQSSGGDLGDVIKAILLDDEARNPPALTDPSGPSYGKLREPILRVTAVWRAFNAQAQPADQYGEIAMNGGNNSLGNYGQGPLESPTVFNFYTPDYSQPGVFADNGLTSPEFQIVNESTIYTVTNSFYQLTAGAFVGMNLLTPPQTPPTNRPLINLSSLIGVSDAQIVTNVNNMMLYGSMSSAMQATMNTLVHTGLAGATPQEKAWSAIYMTMLSPEYATQR
ncbi:MAG: DUF1800 family protein [Rudaea sp.]|nr:DUF1800 family protein [Rudaea sp.]